MSFGLIALSCAIGIFLVLFVYAIINLRVIVPTNQVHIVQSSHKTTPYGRGKSAGNAYYKWPVWIP